MNPLDLIDQMLVQLITLKGPRLMVVVLLMIGYALKVVPWIKNERIPLAVMMLGPLLAPFFIAWPKPGDMEPGIRYPEIAAYFQVCAMGFLIAAMSWILHAKLLKRFIDDKLTNGTGLTAFLNKPKEDTKP